MAGVLVAVVLVLVLGGSDEALPHDGGPAEMLLNEPARAPDLADAVVIPGRANLWFPAIPPSFLAERATLDFFRNAVESSTVSVVAASRTRGRSTP